MTRFVILILRKMLLILNAMIRAARPFLQA